MFADNIGPDVFYLTELEIPAQYFPPQSDKRHPGQYCPRTWQDHFGSVEIPA